MRCFSPPESTSFHSLVLSKPPSLLTRQCKCTSFRISSRSESEIPFCSMLCLVSGYITCSRRVPLGRYGFWGTQKMPWESGRMILPCRTCHRPASMRNREDLPHPFGPVTITCWFFFISKFRPFTSTSLVGVTMSTCSNLMTSRSVVRVQALSALRSWSRWTWSMTSLSSQMIQVQPARPWSSLQLTTMRPMALARLIRREELRMQSLVMTPGSCFTFFRYSALFGPKTGRPTTVQPMREAPYFTRRASKLPMQSFLQTVWCWCSISWLNDFMILSFSHSCPRQNPISSEWFMRLECTARYSPSRRCSCAVSLPKEGETVRMMAPEKMYQQAIMRGPLEPTSSASLPPKRMMSRRGLVKLLKKLDMLVAHLSMSAVSTWSGLGILWPRLTSSQETRRCRYRSRKWSVMRRRKRRAILLLRYSRYELMNEAGIAISPRFTILSTKARNCTSIRLFTILPLMLAMQMLRKVLSTRKPIIYAMSRASRVQKPGTTILSNSVTRRKNTMSICPFDFLFFTGISLGFSWGMLLRILTRIPMTAIMDTPSTFFLRLAMKERKKKSEQLSGLVLATLDNVPINNTLQ